MCIIDLGSKARLEKIQQRVIKWKLKDIILYNRNNKRVDLYRPKPRNHITVVLQHLLTALKERACK